MTIQSQTFDAQHVATYLEQNGIGVACVSFSDEPELEDDSVILEQGGGYVQVGETYVGFSMPVAGGIKMGEYHTNLSALVQEILRVCPQAKNKSCKGDLKRVWFRDLPTGIPFLFGNDLYLKTSKWKAQLVFPECSEREGYKREFLYEDKVELLKRVTIAGKDGTETRIGW